MGGIAAFGPSPPSANTTSMSGSKSAKKQPPPPPPQAAQRTGPSHVPHSSTPTQQQKHKLEAGNEHTGRWTREEHESFLSGLKMHGKDWKKVAATVGTRTVVQTRTHAQKYFQKLSKGEVCFWGLLFLDILLNDVVA